MKATRGQHREARPDARHLVHAVRRQRTTIRSSRTTRTGSSRTRTASRSRPSWGGTCLDMTRARCARAPERHSSSGSPTSGATSVFKMDGLWTGTRRGRCTSTTATSGTRSARPRSPIPTRRTSKRYRDGLKLVREAAGPDVFLLGCCVSQNMRSFGGSFGLVDAMRVGPDTGAGRHRRAARLAASSSSTAASGRTTPTASPSAPSTPLDQARVNATLHGHRRRSVLQQRLDARPARRAARHPQARACPPTTCRRARWTSSRTIRRASGTSTRATGAATSWRSTTGTREPAAIACAAERIGLPAPTEYVAFDFWANQFVPPFRGEADRQPAGGVVPRPRHPARGGPSATAQHLAPRHAGHRGRARREMGCRQQHAQRRQPRCRATTRTNSGWSFRSATNSYRAVPHRPRRTARTCA